jgi:hypothetical protein
MAVLKLIPKRQYVPTEAAMTIIMIGWIEEDIILIHKIVAIIMIIVRMGTITRSIHTTTIIPEMHQRGMSTLLLPNIHPVLDIIDTLLLHRHHHHRLTLPHIMWIIHQISSHTHIPTKLVINRD